MSCTFNKYQNALGVYRVVIDSVLTNVLQNGRTFKPSTDLPKLLEYFRDFQYEASDVEAFTQLALDSVVSAYNLALGELNAQKLTSTKKLSAKDAKLLTMNFKEQLAKLYPQLPAKVPSQGLSQDPPVIQPPANKNPELTHYSAEGSIKLRQNVTVDRATNTKMSDIEFNYFQGASTLSRNLFRNVTTNIFDIRILNPLKTHSADSTKALNKELREYKNDLFSKMIKPLEKDFGLDDDAYKVLYDEIGNVNVPNIDALFKLIANYYEKMNDGVGVRAYDLAVWDVTNKPLLEQYSAFVVLSNFDSILEHRSGNTIKVKENYRNLETPADKYILTSTNKMRTGYSADAIVHADDETTRLFKMFIETIPMVKVANGHVSSNMFLSTKQVYNTFSRLKRDIDNSDPLGSVERVIIDSLLQLEDRGGRNLSITDLNTLFALYLRVFRTAENDSLLAGSSVKLATALSNVSAKNEFNISDSISSSFRNVHTNTTDLNFLDLVAANITKVDSLAYNEIVFNSSTGNYSSRELSGQMSNRQKGVLRSGIGGSLMGFTANNISDFLADHSIKVGGSVVHFNLNGLTLAFNSAQGTFSTVDAEGKTKQVVSPSELFVMPKMDVESADVLMMVNLPESYKNYAQIVDMFESVFNQPLSSDNYKLLDLFRSEIDGTSEDTQGRHLDSMLTLLGNYAVLASMNSLIYNGKTPLTISQVKSGVDVRLPSIGYSRVWDRSQKRYKIDFNKVGAAALDDYAEVMNNYYGDSIKSVTKNTEGNFVPTVSLMSAINRFRDIIADVKTNSGMLESPLAQNYIFKNEDLIVKTLIRSGVKSKNGTVTSPSKMNTGELTYASIMHEFLESKLTNGTFSIQPTNYADKSKQNLLEVNGEIFSSYWDVTKNKWSAPAKYKTFTTNQIRDTYFKTMSDQYERIGKNLLTDYAKLFTDDRAGSTTLLNAFIANEFKSLKLDREALLNLNSELDIPEFFRGTNASSEFKRFVAVRALTEQFKKTKGLTAQLDLIDQIFSNLSEKTIAKAFNDAEVTYTDRFFFEKNVNTGKMGINMSLLPEIKRFGGSDKAEISAKIEREFLESLNVSDFTLDYYDSDGNVNTILDKALTTYNIGDEFKTKLKTHGRLELVDANGKLIPFLKDYLWNNLLIGRNFQFLTVGTLLGHPVKLKNHKKDANGNKIPFTHDQILANRLVAQNKRMVIHPATMHGYTMNLVNGIGFKSKKIFVKDPESIVFNLTGTIDGMEAQDGSSWYLMPSTNMLNASLLDQKVGLTHKSLAGYVDIRTGAATLTKHAGFTITNENIRSSAKLEAIVDNMMSAEFDVIDDMKINIDITKDYNGKHINVPSSIGNVQFNTNHFKERLGHLTFKTVDGDAEVDLKDFVNEVATFKDLESLGQPNMYKIYYKIGEGLYYTELYINNYKTLWDLLGGKNSLSYSNDNLGNNPNSILDGYIRSNTSHDALTEYMNRVGFWYDDGTGYTINKKAKKNVDNRNHFEDYRNHSGGALGADSAFDEIGRLYGSVNNNHYYSGSRTPKGNVLITAEQKQRGLAKLPAAAKRLGRYMSNKAYTLDLLSRNWAQVENSTQIVAVAKISPDFKMVEGGTGYAVAMAQNENENGGTKREINVFNLNDNTWYTWNGMFFTPSEVPTLHKNFAGIGSRQANGVMTEESRQAIHDVFKKSLGSVEEEVEEEVIYANPESKTYRDITDMTDPSQYARVKQFYNDIVISPNSEHDNFSPYINSSVNQKNIIQPLKFNFVGEITNVSGQKVGAKSPVSVDDLLAGRIRSTYETNIHNGIQLNADHHVDGSEVTEQTQIVSTLSFSGDTPEYAKKVFKSVNRHIKKHLGFLMDAVNDPNYDVKPELQTKVTDLLKKIVVKTFDDKEADSLAGSLVRVIRNELTSGVKSNLNLPMSSPDLYNAVNTAVANFFTKEGIRRKMPGMAAIAKPYAEYIKFKRLPTGETVSTELFNRWRDENPDISQYTVFDHNRLEIGQTVVDHEGNSIYITDPKKFFYTKLKFSKLDEASKALWKIDEFADRELGSTHHKIKISGVGDFTYFDFDITLLPHLLRDVSEKYNAFNDVKDLIARGHLKSQFEMLNGTTLEEDYANAESALNEAIELYNQSLANTEMSKEVAPISFTPTDELNYTKFGKRLSNILRTSTKKFFTDLHDTKKLSSSPFFAREIPVGTDIEIETVLGEVAMSYPHRSVFGLKAGQDINEVTEEFFLSELNKTSLPLTDKHDLYIKHSEGDHLHILLAGSDAHNELIMSGDLMPVSEETIVENDKRYSVDKFGRRDKLLGYDQLYQAEVDGKLIRYIILNGDNLQSFERLKEMIKGKGSKYDTIVPNFTAGVDNLPTLLELANKGIFKTNVNHLAKMVALLDSGNGTDLSEFVTELDLNRLNNHVNFQKLYDRVLKGLSQPLLHRNTKKKLNNDRVKLEEYFKYVKDNNIDPNKPELFDDTMLDLTKDLMYLDIDGWVKNKNQWLTRKLRDEEYNDDPADIIEARRRDDIEDALRSLQNKQFDRVYGFNVKKAKAKYASFKKTLEVTTARIPGQDKQSYGAMKVVQFFHDEENVIFVPPSFQWTTGGDFDIDKVFTMYFSTGQDGLISGWSQLFDKRDTNFLNESLRLPVPDEAVTMSPSSVVYKNSITTKDVVKTSSPLGTSVDKGVYVNNNGLDTDEQMQLFEYLKPYLETQASKTNKGVNAPKMMGLGLRWDYVANNPGKTPMVIADPMVKQQHKYAYYNTDINGNPLAEITPEFRALITKATGIDIKDYDGAIINIYDANGFISNHNDVDESSSAEGYPVVAVNIGGSGNFHINDKQTLLKSGAGYSFGTGGENRKAFHRTFPSSVNGFLPQLTTQDGQVYNEGEYRITITMRRVMPLTPDMPRTPIGSKYTVKETTVTELPKDTITYEQINLMQSFIKGEYVKDELTRFKAVVDVLRHVDKYDGKLNISSASTEIVGEESKVPQTVLDYINWFNKESGDSDFDEKGATLNAIFSGVKDSGADIRNIVDAYLGVTFGDYQEKASASKKGEQMSKISPENPIDVFKMQEANMIGKDVIGISAASGLKAYSILSNVMMEVLDGGSGVNMKPFDVPVFVNGKLEFKKGTGIHGINFVGSEEKYKKYLMTTFNLSNTEANTIVVNSLKERGFLSLDLSAILSAATDNAKELILGRINAGPETVGYYLAAAMVGIDVDTISTLMTSDTMESILNVTNKNSFLGRQTGFEYALQQIKNSILKTKDVYFSFNKAINLSTALSSYSDLVEEAYIEDMVNKSSTSETEKLRMSIRERLHEHPLYKSNAFEFLEILPKVVDIKDPKVRDNITSLLENHTEKVDPRGYTYNKPKVIVTEDVDVDAEIDASAFDQDYSDQEEYQDGADMDALYDMLAAQESEYDEAMSTRTPKEPVNSLASKNSRNILPFLYNRYLDDYDRLIASAKIDKDVVKALSSISRIVSDLNVLAKIASVNQSIRNNFLDLKKFIDVIEDYKVENYSTDKVYVGSDTSVIDVLGVIKKSPHMRSMVSAAYSAFNIMKKSSVKSTLLDTIINENELPKDPQTFGKVSRAVEELLIGSFLNDLPNMDSSFIILNGSKVSQDQEKTKFTKTVNVKTAEGRIEFVEWFENQVIPDLKKGVITDFDNSGKVNRHQSTSVKANEFIKRLTTDVGVDLGMNTSYSYYRIPIDMLNTNTESEKEIMDLLKFNYAKLQGVRYMGKDITDMFFLYNLIVNKGRVNSVSLNGILDAITDDYSDQSLASKYVRTIGEYDANSEKTPLTKFTYSQPFLSFLSSKGIGKMEEELPALGNVVNNKNRFVVVKKYNAYEEMVETNTYIADASTNSYVRTNPTVSTKYLNVPNLNTGEQLLITSKVSEGIKRDKLNKLIARASRRIIDC